MTTLWIPISPVAASRPQVPRFGKPYYKGRYKQYRKEVSDWLASNWEGEAMSGPLRAEVWFCVPKPKTSKLRYPKPDIDNFIKAVFDALNGLMWEDDYQIVQVDAEKMWCLNPSEGGTRIEVQSVDE